MGYFDDEEVDTPAMRQVRGYFDDSPLQTQEMPAGFNDTPAPVQQDEEPVVVQPQPIQKLPQQQRIPQGLIGSAPQVQQAPLQQPQQANAFARGADPNLLVPALNKTGQANQDVSLRNDQVRALTGENPTPKANQGQDVFDTKMEPDDWWRNVRDEIARNPDGSTAQKFNHMRLNNPEGLKMMHDAALEADKQKRLVRADQMKMDHENAKEKRQEEIRKQQKVEDWLHAENQRILANQDAAEEFDRRQGELHAQKETGKQAEKDRKENDAQHTLDAFTKAQFKALHDKYPMASADDPDADPIEVEQFKRAERILLRDEKRNNPDSKYWKRTGENDKVEAKTETKAQKDAKVWADRRAQAVKEFTHNPTNYERTLPSEDWINRYLMTAYGGMGKPIPPTPQATPQQTFDQGAEARRYIGQSTPDELKANANQLYNNPSGDTVLTKPPQESLESFKARWTALPSGSWYIDPRNGQRKQKP